MPTTKVECDDGHRLRGWKQCDLAMKWHPGLLCEECPKPVRWYGQWNPQRDKPNEKATTYEVKFVARLDDDKPFDEWDGGYFPHILVCENKANKHLEIGPRYFVGTSRRPKFGQDGPRLLPDQWRALLKKIDDFLSKNAR